MLGRVEPARQRGRHRRAAISELVLAFGALVIMNACSSPTGTPLVGGLTNGQSGFPLGSFAKAFREPEQGHIRLIWTFGEDGRWTEVPVALDGQTIMAPPIRGRYSVTGDEVTIEVTWPPDWGTSRHTWRWTGDGLWTAFESSTAPADADWFALLDTQPWTPVR
jgi:hypothetical protein